MATLIYLLIVLFLFLIFHESNKIILLNKIIIVLYFIYFNNDKQIILNYVMYIRSDVSVFLTSYTDGLLFVPLLCLQWPKCCFIVSWLNKWVKTYFAPWFKRFFSTFTFWCTWYFDAFHHLMAQGLTGPVCLEIMPGCLFTLFCHSMPGCLFTLFCHSMPGCLFTLFCHSVFNNIGYKKSALVHFVEKSSRGEKEMYYTIRIVTTSMTVLHKFLCFFTLHFFVGKHLIPSGTKVAVTS